MRPSSMSSFPSDDDLDYKKELEKRTKSYITIDFGKYAGTYSINEARGILRKMKAEISKTEINIDVLEKELKEEKKNSKYKQAVEHNKDIPYIQFEKHNIIYSLWILVFGRIY